MISYNVGKINVIKADIIHKTKAAILTPLAGKISGIYNQTIGLH
jgi:hypothetical protein